MNQVLTIQQLDVTLDNQTILKDISFSLATGEILGLVGPSGCGKTTLLNTVAGFISQKSGEITIGDKLVINKGNNVAPEKRQVGMIFQDYALFPHLTVEQNIAFGISKMPKDEQVRRIEQLLSLLSLEGLADRYPHQLSGGQQQRVAIARAIAPKPKLLLLDEPFSNIDARLRQSLMLELRQLFKSQNITAIFVTHNKDEVFTFADKMAVMSSGNILQFGAPADICKSPNSFQVADFLQLGSWLPCHVSGSNLLTALGQFAIDSERYAADSEQAILINPQHISIEASEGGQMQVSNISVTEQGFHYYLTSLKSDEALAIEQLSVYSPQIFALEEKVQVTIKPHDFLVFTTKPH